MKGRFNMLRSIELQIKNGYMVDIPEEFEFLRRYPPVSRDRPATLKNIKPQFIPYARYYDKILVKNPDLVGEHVYPAYWRQQPLALILAKKQYEFIQQGLSEDEAYNKAVECVDVEESKSYDAMKVVLDHIEKANNARKSFTTDPKLAEIVEAWRAKLENVPYDNLTLAEQGEIDFLVQTMVLKWNEVERERRMKDPIYYIQFCKLRATIFPQIDKNFDHEKEKKRRDEFMTHHLTSMGIDHRMMHTKAPFFYEDYVHFFTKLKQQPLLTKWPPMEQQNFSKFIVNVLALPHILEDPGVDWKSVKEEKVADETEEEERDWIRTPEEEQDREMYIQNYVDSVRAQFFPIVQYPDRVEEFNLPSIQDFKQMLYDNDIGYKRGLFDKLYVKRFYKIPSLLFPKDTIITYLLYERSVMENMSEPEKKEFIESQIELAGLDMSDTKLVNEIIDTLQKYIHQYQKAEIDSSTGITRLNNFDQMSSHGNDEGGHDYSNSSGGGSYTNGSKGIDMSFLDDLIHGSGNNSNNKNNEANKDTFLNRVVTNATAGDMIEDDDLEDSSRDTSLDEMLAVAANEEEDNIEDEDQLLGKMKKKPSMKPQIVTAITPFTTPVREKMTDTEWNKLVTNYFKKPVTALDQEREIFYSRFENSSVEHAEQESELYELQKIRMENKIIMKARLEHKYEEKEAARRVAEWKRRKVFKGFKLPKPSIKYKSLP